MADREGRGSRRIWEPGDRLDDPILEGGMDVTAILESPSPAALSIHTGN